MAHVLTVRPPRKAFVLNAHCHPEDAREHHGDALRALLDQMFQYCLDRRIMPTVPSMFFTGIATSWNNGDGQQVPRPAKNFHTSCYTTRRQ